MARRPEIVNNALNETIANFVRQNEQALECGCVTHPVETLAR
jgi:hypothetical protein